MSLVGGGGLQSQSHLNGGGCASFHYSSDAAMVSEPVTTDIHLGSPANTSVHEKNISESCAAEKKSSMNGIAAHVNNALPSPTVVIQPPESIQMQWDRRYVYIPEPVGLLNAGNTCFLNSVLQCLTFTAPLANYFLTNGHKRDMSCGDFCIMCRMQNHIKMCFTINSRFYKPNGILERLQMIARHMERGRQEDAHEFLRCLTEAMQKRLLMNYKNLDQFSQETTLLNQIFGGYLRSQVVCCNCGAVSNTYEPFLDVSLDVKDVNSVEEALKTYTRVETLNNENMYGCESCHRKVKAYKRFTIHQAPRVLTFQLKRYSANSSIKLNNRTNFPVSMDIYRYLSDTLDGKPTHIYYELYGVLIHCGLTTTSGHYYCCAKSSNKNWYKLNDGVVTQIQVSDVTREEPYLLFYIQSGIKRTVPNASPKVATGASNQLSFDSGSPLIPFSKTASSTISTSLMSRNIADIREAPLIGPHLPCTRTPSSVKLICKKIDTTGSATVSHKVSYSEPTPIKLVAIVKDTEDGMIGSQIPCSGSALVNLVANGNVMPCLDQNVSHASKLVRSTNGSVASPASCSTNILSSSGPAEDIHSLVDTSQSPSILQSDVSEMKSVTDRCKISFNIKSNVMSKTKCESKMAVTVSSSASSHKLVSYEEGISDDSDCENTAPISGCGDSSSSAIGDNLTACNVLLTNRESKTADNLLPVQGIQLKQGGFEESDSLIGAVSRHSSLTVENSSEDLVQELDSSSMRGQTSDAAPCDLVAEDVSLLPAVHQILPYCDVLSSHDTNTSAKPSPDDCISVNGQSVNGTIEHNNVNGADDKMRSSKRKRHSHSKRSKSHKRIAVNNYSSDDAEFEYVWVEKPPVVTANVQISKPCLLLNGAIDVLSSGKAVNDLKSRSLSREICCARVNSKSPIHVVQREMLKSSEHQVNRHKHHRRSRSHSRSRNRHRKTSKHCRDSSSSDRRRSRSQCRRRSRGYRESSNDNFRGSPSRGELHHRRSRSRGRRHTQDHRESSNVRLRTLVDMESDKSRHCDSRGIFRSMSSHENGYNKVSLQSHSGRDNIQWYSSRDSKI